MPSKLIPGEKKTPVYKKSSPTKQFFGPTMGDPVNAGGGMGAGVPVDYGQNIGQTAMYQKIKNTGTPPYKMQGHTLPGINQKSALQSKVIGEGTHEDHYHAPNLGKKKKTKYVPGKVYPIGPA